MRKILKKLNQKINNSGSGVILVIVALTFIGVLVGALLTAVGYVYKMKLYDYNARDNFYYVEQAMNEIYAGVGTRTVSNMEKAYETTMNQMVRFDVSTGEYVNLGNAEANEVFDTEFLNNVAGDTFFTTNLASSLASCISNKSVYLDATKLRVVRYDVDGNIWDPSTGVDLEKIVIENVTVTRTADYERSQANGQFKQTISTDIEIAKPDFLVEFNNTTAMNQDLFNFAIIADAGVEIQQDLSKPLTIKGNIYAAADFYNKKYNYYENPVDFIDTDYVLNPVSTLGKLGDGTNQFNLNHYIETMGDNGTGEVLYYDGVNELSRYSGLYINHSDVSILGDTIIVPGTIAVMNTSKFSAYSKTGEKITNSSIWADNLVIDGYSTTVARSTPDSKGHTSDIVGPSATLRAYLYVKDDTELNAAGSKFSLNGSYYGFGNSTVADNRDFIEGVDMSVYKYLNADGSQTARGHYNSSAIIVNGERSTIDLSNTDNIFLAGKTYIELSKKVNSDETQDVITGYDENGDAIYETVKVETYVFDATTKDYKTGESLSVKSNQVAYIPLTPKTMPTEKLNSQGQVMYYVATLDTDLRNSELFVKHFGQTNDIPCIKATVSAKNYYYYDFDTAWEQRRQTEGATFTNEFPSAEDLAESFIVDYVAELNNKYSAIKEYLTDITAYEDFEPGTIKLPDTDVAKVYSSGAMTSIEESTDTLSVLDGVEFNVVANKNTNITSILKNSETVNPNTNAALSVQALNYSSNFEKHYNYVKWCLTDLRDDSDEASFVDSLVADDRYGTGCITPINRYMNFDKITIDTQINPDFGDGTTGDSILTLVSGDKVWVSNENVTIKANADDNISATVEDGTVSGIVIAKGDVFFGQSVRKFEGMIISGGKVYICNNTTEISSNPQLIKKILSSCQISGTDAAKTLLSLFKGYEDSAITKDVNDTGARTIDTLDYTDVVRYNNWMKNVE